MSVFELKAILYEGEDIDLGLYATREGAEKAKEQAQEDWAGPNVHMLDITERHIEG